MKKLSPVMQRFDRVLKAMATQPEPAGKQQGDNQTSDKGSGAGYGDTRTRAGKKAGVSSQPITPAMTAPDRRKRFQ
jgi:hypothetical protein